MCAYVRPRVHCCMCGYSVGIESVPVLLHAVCRYPLFLSFLHPESFSCVCFARAYKSHTHIPHGLDASQMMDSRQLLHLPMCTWKRWRGVPDRPPILARRVRLAYLHTNTSSLSCVCVLICIRMHATDGGMHRLATHTRHTSGCAGNEPASAA